MLLRLAPPIFILIAAACWLLTQANTARHLESENQEIRTRLATRSPADQPARPRPTTALDRDPRDWSEVAAELRSRHLIAGVLPSNIRLGGALDALDADDILAALDEIAAAGLLTADREFLEKQLCYRLISKDPEAAFSHFSKPGRYDWDFFLGARFANWVEREPDRAVNWLHRHTAGGGKVFDRMISQPFFAALSDDTALAASILTALPETSRLESLRCLSVGRLHEAEGQKEWAQVVRSHLPEPDHLKAIAWPLGNWSDGDGSPMLFADVDAYLDRIGATPEERQACILQVAAQPHSWRDTRRERPPFAEGIDHLRSWVAEHSPDLVDQATVRALEYAAKFSDFGKASTTALRLHEETGNPAYLNAILKDVHRLDKHENVSRILDLVTDEARLEQYREQIR